MSIFELVLFIVLLCPALGLLVVTSILLGGDSVREKIYDIYVRFKRRKIKK
jgi:hypothetical protein